MTNRSLSILVSFLFIACCANAQTAGCTDPDAINYNSNANWNDGSCSYNPTHYTPTHRANFPSTITQSSGLEWTDGKLWTHNDGGSSNEIYSVDTSNGHIHQTVIVDNYTNTDWEDITADSNFIYIGDCGNNNGTRTDLRILKFPKSSITSASTVHVTAQAIRFSYNDQTVFTSSSTHNFDCEAVVAIKDSLYLFTKDRGDNHTRVYRLPKTPGTYPVSPIASYDVGGLITGADYNSSTHEITLIGYESGHVSSFLWVLNSYHGDNFFSGNKRRIEIGNGQEWQTEGIAYMANERLFISCEAAGTIASGLYVLQKPAPTILSAVYTGNSTVQVYPNPASDQLVVEGIESTSKYTLHSISGQYAGSGTLNTGSNRIEVSQLMAGAYILCITDGLHHPTYCRILKAFQ